MTFMSLCCRLTVVIGCLVLSPLQGQAEQKPGKSSADGKQPPAISLVVRPAAPPRSALKYQLLPSSVLDRRPGNAAVHYGRIAMLLADKSQPDKLQKVAEWLETPLEKLPRAEVAKLLGELKSVLEELDLAARRQRCDWDLPLGERGFFSILLPELGKLRELSRIVALQARLQIAEGRLDEALHTLQTGFSLARHAAEGPTLINGLVGIAIAEMMGQRVREFVQQPEAPNLYWALTALPRPLVDMRPAVETEMHSVYLSFPTIREIDRSRRDLAYWQRWLDEFQRTLEPALGRQPEWSARVAVTLLALKGYPQAKQALIAEGLSPQEVEAMPVPAIVILYSLQTYEELRDRIFQWFFVPYWEAREGLQEADRYFQSEGFQREIVPLASLLLPALGRVAFVSARSQRTIAALRTVEAIRIYGAANGGRLPEDLAQIKEVPVPIDPTTGQAFAYRRSGDMAVLESPGERVDDRLRLEITFARPAK